MNREFDEGNLGKVFKEAFENYEIKPKRVNWQDISKQIPKSKPKSLKFSKWYLFAASAVVLSVAAIFFFKKDDLTTSRELKNPLNLPKQDNLNSQSSAQILNEQKTNNDIVAKAQLSIKKPQDFSNNQNQEANVNMLVNQVDEQIEKTIITNKPDEIIPLKEDKKTVEVNPDLPLENRNDDETQKPATTANGEPNNEIIKYSENPLICEGEKAILVVQGGKSYSWNTGENDSKISVKPTETTEYIVWVYDEKGIGESHTFVVQVDNNCDKVAIPSSFTPNGDGINDYFKVESSNITDFELIIVNKQGVLVFRSRDINEGWDGYFNGVLQPAQIFFYVINYTNSKGVKKQEKGQLFLIK